MRHIVIRMNMILMGVAGCSTGPEPGPPGPCGDAPVEMYEDGFSQQTAQGRFTVTWVEADPNPPAVGENRWRLLVLDNGAPAVGSFVRVEPFLEAEQLGLTPRTLAGIPTSEPGVFQLEPFVLPVEGAWSFEVLVTEGMLNASAAFTLCVVEPAL